MRLGLALVAKRRRGGLRFGAEGSVEAPVEVRHVRCRDDQESENEQRPLPLLLA